ncbi:MAG: hypothetical protein ACRCV3_04475 [Desulfovibrionaceae bacterium]
MLLPKTIQNISYSGDTLFLMSLKKYYSVSTIPIPYKDNTYLFYMSLHILSRKERIQLFNSIQNTAKEYFFIDYTLVNRNVEYISSWYKYITTYVFSHKKYPQFYHFMKDGALEGILYQSHFTIINAFRFHKRQIALYHCKD